MKLLQSGRCEPLKCGVHVGLGLFAGVCLAYNAAAWAMRRERHLRRNALFYAVVVAIEVAQVRHHCKQ